MFTGKIEVQRLKGKDVNRQVVDDVNSLLQKQWSGARTITVEMLHKCLGKMAVVVACNDAERVVGLGVLTLSGGLNFDCLEIRHLVVAEGQDILSVGMRIVQALLEVYIHNIVYIDAGSWLQDGEMAEIFKTLGFKQKPNSRWRLRLK